MRELIIYCDCCGKKIEGDPYKIFAEQVDREHGEIVNWATDETERKEKLYGKDWCMDCFHRVIDNVIAVKNIKTETDADEKKSKSKIDMGKLKALHEAGWKVKDMAVEFGVSGDAIYRKLRQLRDEGEEKKWGENE